MKEALVPLKVTEEADRKFEPVIVTVVLTKPLAGEKPVIPGAGGGPARALIKFVPVGVPQPVHRSKPVTAGYLLLVPLLPVVVS